MVILTWKTFLKNVSTYLEVRGKNVDYLKCPTCSCNVMLKDEFARAVTYDGRNCCNSIMLQKASLTSTVGSTSIKLSTTRWLTPSPTVDHMCTGILSQCLFSWLLRLVIMWVFFAVAIVMSVFHQWTEWHKQTSLHEHFSATVSNGWVLPGSLLPWVTKHSEFWAPTFHKVM